MALTDNLIAVYKLSNTTDTVGGFTLTNNNSVSFATTGIHGNAADFGAANTNKYLSVSNNLGLAGDGSMTVSYWVKLSAEIGSGSWVFTDHRTTSSVARYLSSVYDYNAGTRRIRVNSSNTFTDYTVTLGTSSFYHIVLKRTTTTAIELYVNGVSVSTGSAGTATDTPNIFTIGADAGGTGPVSGVIDECYVWSRAISAAEVTQLYNAGIGVFYPFLISTSTDTSTVTDSVTVLKVKVSTNSDTTSVSDSVSATVTPIASKWTNQTKHTTTWINQTKH